MKTVINNFRKPGGVCLFVLAVFLASLNVRGQTAAVTDPVGFIARAATYLLTAPLTDQQVQSLHAQNFYQLPPSLRPLYLHAVAFQVGATIATGAPVPEPALAEYLLTADPDELFGAWSPEPNLTEALREVNGLLANEIAANPLYQRAIRSGAVNGIFNADTVNATVT